ncbi:hypothetical protein GCM10023189_54890 [Nibrella saemangeumensis]|uniref:ADP-ribosylglycohydrolase n=1 Tax=Nibrella saemangeumensis TaxID=1084526 RepID=A0ABP8NP84_9BACT
MSLPTEKAEHRKTDRPALISYQTYYDKVLGGWTGKCAGGILGAPIEGLKRFNDIELSDSLFDTNFPNDDLDLQVLWLDVVKKRGPTLRESDLAGHWLAHVGFPWNEYGIATRNLRLGLYPPASGSHNNQYWQESMGCPIRSEIWGMLNPGNPERAMFYARMDASLDHAGFSVDAEAFLAACAALAFVEDDVRVIMQQGVSYFSPDATLYRLVSSVQTWYAEGGYAVAIGKIKSYWGDADFTSAPMNVGFTLLALLHKGNDFSCVLDALHMGHDADCVSATAGALVGIISGYEALSDTWKRRVGNELLISAEIHGIDAPATLSDLAEQTCRAGRSFIDVSGDLVFSDDWPQPYPVQPNRFHLTLSRDKALWLHYDNLEGSPQQVELSLTAGQNFLPLPALKTWLDPFDSQTLHCPLPEAQHGPLAETYRIQVCINGEPVATLTRGFPRYGAWLLLGPFIEDDPAQIPCDPRYPEHGLSSLPSVRYMNHDRISQDKEFLSLDDIRRIADEPTWATHPFMVQRIQPASFAIDLPAHYYGRGERTLYLYSRLTLPEATRLWVSMGCTAPFTLWLNGERVHQQTETRRTWPGQTAVDYAFRAGENDLLMRIDAVTDEPRLEIGFKEFTHRHPHQSQWALVVPTV